jgi:hypothetical protein
MNVVFPAPGTCTYVEKFCVSITASDVGESRFLLNSCFLDGSQAGASGFQPATKLKLLIREHPGFLCGLKLQEDFFDHG